LIFVSVSSNGADFARFPVVSITPAAVSAFGTINPANVSGFAGVHPVLANIDANTIDPFDPAVSGGDSFDLSALSNDPLVLSGKVSLLDINYIRLDDVLGNGSLLDSNSHTIFDPTGAGNNGGDVDAVVALHGGASVLPEPATGLMSLVALFATNSRRNRR